MWWCGLKTFTVTAGDRVELNCLQEVLEDKGRFSWRVIWRFAKGLITPEDALFARLKAPMMDRVILDPVTESDAGTYRCTVLDSAFRRVKRIEWGIRVLPVGFMDLQYHSSQEDWDQQNQTVTSTQQNKERTALKVVCGDELRHRWNDIWTHRPAPRQDEQTTAEMEEMVKMILNVPAGGLKKCEAKGSTKRADVQLLLEVLVMVIHSRTLRDRSPSVDRLIPIRDESAEGRIIRELKELHRLTTGDKYEEVDFSTHPCAIKSCK
ncbi:uncharacterized protein LOC117506130 [Thalassophryne amazonica]|uniref:uncharacterized protein LOC117506130 n=1 Tax=Thalassophryne amazonica TaxID=390379 RepID=UPI001471B4F7|nr:uncharacterized protein LOC117506130 [Thalassophryne amazonica]